MIENPMTKSSLRYLLTVLTIASVVLASHTARTSAQTIGDEFSGNSEAYYDQFSSSCDGGNTSPYAGMDPLACHGVMMPVDSRGECSGERGWQLLKQVGSTCYFCQPLNPPINGIIIPLDQLNNARVQGYRCGVDQADPNCMAVCTSETGAATYIPPGGSAQTPAPPTLSGGSGTGGCTPPDYLSPAERAQWYQTYIYSGRIRCPGAYNPCDNPDAPSWCSQARRRPPPPTLVSCGDESLNNEASISLVQMQTSAPPLQTHIYQTRTRDYNGNTLGPIRRVCVRRAKIGGLLRGALELDTLDGTFQLTRMQDAVYEVPGPSTYGVPSAPTREQAAQYQVSASVRLDYRRILFVQKPWQGQIVGFDAYYYGNGPQPLRSETWIFNEFATSYWQSH